MTFPMSFRSPIISPFSINHLMRISSTQPLIAIIGGYLKYINRRNKIFLCFLVVLMLLSAFAEILTIGSVIPFLTVILISDNIDQANAIFSIPLIGDLVYDIPTSGNLALVLTICFAIIAFAIALKVINLCLTSFFTASISSDLSTLAFAKTLHQSYETHLARNSANIINTLILMQIEPFQL